jgi:hypothetical protein
MAILIDDVAATAAMVRDLRRQDPVLEIYPQMIHKLKGAPRFLLDESATRTTVELTLGRPKVMLDALRDFRLPYQVMWVEWPEHARKKIRDVFPGLNDGINDLTPLPERVGFLIEATDDTGRRGKIIWLWNGGNADVTRELMRQMGANIPNVAPISPYFDLDRVHEKQHTESFLRNNLVKYWLDNPIQLDSLYGIWQTADHRFSRWGLQYCQSMIDYAGEEAVKSRIPYMWSDVYGEYIVAWAALLLLTSSRRVVTYRNVDRAKQNKLRRLRKQPLLQDHTEVTLYIGEKHDDGQRRQPLGYARKSPRVHMVSSFLNHRGSKHWIVAPFWRGEGETIHRRVNVKG